MPRLPLLILIAGVLTENSGRAQVNACDLAAPFGTVDVSDVQAAVNMALGVSACTANIGGGNVCNVVVVQRVINAALTGTCDTSTGVVPHSATLTWTASATPNVSYRVYRSTALGGPYTAVNSTLVTGTTYVDNTVRGGITYYYVVRAVDSTGTESSNSNEAPAAVPTP